MDAAIITALFLGIAAVITSLGTFVINWRNASAMQAKQELMIEKQTVAEEKIDEVHQQTNHELSTLRSELGDSRKIIEAMRDELATQEKTRAVLAAETRVQPPPGE